MFWVPDLENLKIVSRLKIASSVANEKKGKRVKHAEVLSLNDAKAGGVATKVLIENLVIFRRKLLTARPLNASERPQNCQLRGLK